jgi:PhnB protein
MPGLNPYLIFSGNCEEAFNFYKSVFGGDFINFSRFSEVPSDQAFPEEEKEKIMHVALPVGKGSVLMGSDSPARMGKVTEGTNFSISIHTDSEKQTDDIFNKLSAGGMVTMPVNKTFWGAYFGMLTDKYGINWMVSYDTQNMPA